MSGLTPHMKPRRAPARRGVATLVVVMVLFFILALTAAYTNRNLIFEQKTSSNQYRSTQAFEAAEAGLEWALAQLNGGFVNSSCQPDNTNGRSFRDRYLGMFGSSPTILADGTIVPRTRSNGAALLPACAFDGSNWRCNCPDDAPGLPAFNGSDTGVMFRVQFKRPDINPDQQRPAVIEIVSRGFTRCGANCFATTPQAPPGEAMAAVSALVALRSGLATPPGAALTVQGNFVVTGGASATVINTDPVTNGVTIMAGGSLPPGLTLQSLPGTPGDRSVVAADASLAALGDDERMFTSVFGAGSALWRRQPAAVTVTCTAPCNAATVQAQAALYPGSVLWIEGDLLLDGALGSDASPVVMVVNGRARLVDGGVLRGLIYGRAEPWNIDAGAAQVRGALVAQGALTSGGNQTFIYDAGILDLLRTRYGSFVRVPGGWQDFRQ